MKRRRALMVGGFAACIALGALALLNFRGLSWLGAKTYSATAGEALRASEGGRGVVLVPVADGLTHPVAVEFVPGGQGRAIVLEKEGNARLVDLSNVDEKTPGLASASVLVFRIPVRAQSEMGLLGIAFHPNYRENGRFFVHYNPADGSSRTVVAEWHLAPSDLGQKRARAVRTILSTEQPFANHDGGHLVFGPDGYLYIGLGDGGSANDPHGNGQNLGTLLGAMLRIDVDGVARPYGIPKDNPFVGKQGARPEIWAYGLRNPWRYSFDPSGRLIVADVGQNLYEEIDVVTRGSNLGWNVREGKHCFSPRDGCSTAGLTDPIFEYGRDLGSSVTGGVTYTGKRIPSLKGRFVFGDFVSGNLWALELSADGKRARDVQRLGTWRLNPSTFARSASGEVIVAGYDTGILFRLDPAPLGHGG